MFPGYSFLGYSGNLHNDVTTVDDDLVLLSKFYKKYPEVKYFPSPSRFSMGFGGSIEVSHPAALFIKKQRALLRKGYTEQKAFEIVEEELGSMINK